MYFVLDLIFLFFSLLYNPPLALHPCHRSMCTAANSKPQFILKGGWKTNQRERKHWALLTCLLFCNFWVVTASRGNGSGVAWDVKTQNKLNSRGKKKVARQLARLFLKKFIFTVKKKDQRILFTCFTKLSWLNLDWLFFINTQMSLPWSLLTCWS